MSTELSPDPDAPDSTQRKWKVENKTGTAILILDWMDVRLVSDAVIELLASNAQIHALPWNVSAFNFV